MNTSFAQCKFVKVLHKQNTHTHRERRRDRSKQGNMLKHLHVQKPIFIKSLSNDSIKALCLAPFSKSTLPTNVCHIEQNSINVF